MNIQNLKSNFLKNVLIVVSGTAMAQIITMLASPLITRLYGPVEYGILGVFISLSVIVLPIAALQFPTALVISRDEKDVKDLISASLLSSIVISGIVLVIILISGDYIIKLMELDISKSILLLLPLMMIFACVFQISQQLAIRYQAFKDRARVAVTQSIILNSSNILMGYIYPIGISLIVISVFSKVIHGLHLLYKIKFKMDYFKHENLNKLTKSIRRAFKNYYDFPKYRAPQVLINGLSDSAPVLVLSYFFGPASAGFFLLAKKILDVPVVLIGNAIGDVFYPKITESFYKGENTFKILLKSNIVLFIIGIIPFGLLYLIGPVLFEFIYGSSWYKAGEYAKWLSVFLFGMFITRTTIKILPVYGIQKFHLNFTIISTIIRITALIVISYFFGNDVFSIMIYSIAGLILYLYLAVFVLVKGRLITHSPSGEEL